MTKSSLISRLEKGNYLHIAPQENGRDYPLSLSGYGHDRTVVDQPLKCHYSDITVFEFIVSGNLVYRENVTDYLVGAGEMFILHRALPHDYNVGPSGYAHKRFVNIRSTCINAILQSVGLHKPQVIRFENPSKIQAIFREIGHQTQQQQPGFQQKLSMLLYQLILEASASSNSSNPLAVQKAITYMRAHISEKITLDDLVKISGGSVRHFSRVFKQATGESPLQWLLSLRRNEAIALICQTDLPIGEIARRTGYSDPLAFSAFFKKHMGQSPTEMRAKARPGP
ncbi:AraC family transcriptional regulator [Kiritimatiellaeota bacterium B1221]|nr:AraC family transcriptional regulator [Kiritimatiellaeota bacterium B1221]